MGHTFVEVSNMSAPQRIDRGDLGSLWGPLLVSQFYAPAVFHEQWEAVLTWVGSALTRAVSVTRGEVFGHLDSQPCHWSCVDAHGTRQGVHLRRVWVSSVPSPWNISWSGLGVLWTGPHFQLGKSLCSLLCVPRPLSCALVIVLSHRDHTVSFWRAQWGGL